MFKKSGEPTFNKKSLLSLLSETLLKKTKDDIVGSRLPGTVISRRMVIAIRTGLVRAIDPGKAFAFLRSNQIFDCFFCFRYTIMHSSLLQSEKK